MSEMREDAGMGGTAYKMKYNIRKRIRTKLSHCVGYNQNRKILIVNG